MQCHRFQEFGNRLYPHTGACQAYFGVRSQGFRPIDNNDWAAIPCGSHIVRLISVFHLIYRAGCRIRGEKPVLLIVVQTDNLS